MMRGDLSSITARAIRAEVDERIFSRGAAYWRGGRVTQVTCQGNRLSAFVAGSRAKPYRVEWTEMPRRALQCRCSCPFTREWGGPCKHAVATLLAWMAQRDAHPAHPTIALAGQGALLEALELRVRRATHAVQSVPQRRALAVRGGSPEDLWRVRLRRVRPFLRSAPAWASPGEAEGAVRLPMAWWVAGEFFAGSTGLQAEVSVEEPQAGVLITLKGLPSKRQATFRIPREEVPSFVAQCRQASDFIWQGAADRLVLRRRAIEPCLMAEYDQNGRLVLTLRYGLREGAGAARWLTPEERDAGRCGADWWWGPSGLHPIATIPRRLRPYTTGEKPLVYEGEAIPQFLDADYRLLSQEIAFRPSEAVRGTRVLSAPSVSHVRVEVDGPEWLWCDLRFRADDYEIALREILQAQGRGRFLQRGVDWIRVPDRAALLHSLGTAEPDAEGRVRMNRLQYLRARAEWDPARVRLEESRQARRFRELVDRLAPPADPPPLDGTMTALRPYQDTGYRWLWFLHINGFHGLLADEMGLGKTHQAMALLSAAWSQGHGGERADGALAQDGAGAGGGPGRSAPSLVICPTTVLDHWEDKLCRHAPSLGVLRLHGGERPRALAGRALPPVVLTTYTLLVKELAALEPIRWEYVVLDEGQKVKNPATQVARAVKRLRARHRLALSGTPLENRPMELWSIFEFLLPGYLGSARAFRERFERPIVQAGDADAIERLRRLTSPFTLRRVKADVLSELPPKIEDIRTCELTSHQAVLYRATLERAAGVIDTLCDRSRPIEYLHIFAVLTRLKRLCDHPALVLRGARARGFSSGKFAAFQELLEETLAAGQKVVIFSQYLEMLDLVAALLRRQRVVHVQLRGDTRDRRRVIETFQRDPACRVFLGSLLAGGLGIDLTAASVVIHYDRWWNAAREDQATDRVHRIGQTRGVQVFKFVTKGTLEERIHRLIERKRGLMEALVTTDAAPLKSFTREELLELLDAVPELTAPRPRRRSAPPALAAAASPAGET